MFIKYLIHASIVLGAGNIVVSKMDTHTGLRELEVRWGKWVLTPNKTKPKLKLKELFERKMLIFNPCFSLILFEQEILDINSLFLFNFI